MTTEKIQWIDEEEDDVIVGSESVCGRFSIEGRYIEGDKPSYFVVTDAQPFGPKRKFSTVDSVAQAKKWATERRDAKPPVIKTTEQRIREAVNAYHLCGGGDKIRAIEARSAMKKFGVDITTMEPSAEDRAAFEKFKRSLGV